MKNIVRAFVIALVLTGSAATAYTAKSGTVVTNATTVNAIPKPTCPLDDPNNCGLGKNR